ncbi:uncharacterized protein TNCT_645811 [Trichonephila clavata]|uniref:Uncharacterized protein n=1 Tax=Trichonephila clavata TaxID=2740835 RepID=A0A8X6GS23_TRICU|nr:uncharacterized protein TNCT_645811 [Trichonephila clavata]
MSEASLSSVKHKIQLPEDGCLKPLSKSKNVACNIMIIKVPEEMRKPGELTYQLATCDRSIPGIEWPADKIVDQLIYGTSRESQKPIPDPKQNCPVYFRERRLSKKKRGTLLPEHHKNKIGMKKISANDIDPWIKKPWEDSSYLGVNPVVPVNSSSSMISNLPYNMDMSGPVPMNPKPPLISNLHYNSMNMPGPVCSSYDLEAMHRTNNTIYKNNYNKNLGYKGMSSTSYMHNSARNQRNELLMSTMPDSPHSFVLPSNNGLIRNDPPARKGLLGDFPAYTQSFNKNFERFPRENLKRFDNNHASFEYSIAFGNNSLSSKSHLKGSRNQSRLR